MLKFRALSLNLKKSFWKKRIEFKKQSPNKAPIYRALFGRYTGEVVLKFAFQSGQISHIPKCSGENVSKDTRSDDTDKPRDNKAVIDDEFTDTRCA